MFSTMAEAVAKVIMKQWVAQYGVPDQVHYYQGHQFTSDLFRGLLKLFGVTCTTIPHTTRGPTKRSGSIECWVIYFTKGPNQTPRAVDPKVTFGHVCLQHHGLQHDGGDAF